MRCDDDSCQCWSIFTSLVGRESLDLPGITDAQAVRVGHMRDNGSSGISDAQAGMSDSCSRRKAITISLPYC